MKINMFTQILLASLLPVILIFVIVIATMQNIILNNNISTAKGNIEMSGEKLSESLNWRFEHLETMLKNTSTAMGSLDVDSPTAKAQLEAQLYSVSETIPYTYCTWYVFEPEVFGDEKHYTKNYLRSNGTIENFIDPEDELLDDPEATDWYHLPFSTGKPYVILWDLYSYTEEDEEVYTFSLTYPIYQDNKVIGCIGADLRFEELFNIEITDSNSEEYVMLVAETGIILFSSDGEHVGSSILDYENLNETFKTAISEKESLSIEVDSHLTNMKALVAISPLAIPITEQEVYLYQETSLDKLYESFYPALQLIIITSATGLLLLIYSVYEINRRTASNITRLTENFKRIADSDDLNDLNELKESKPTKIVELNSLNESKIRMVEKLQKVRELEIQTGLIELEREKLLATADAKSNFFASISHEIRTPMNSILGISEIMLHDEIISEEQREHIRDINVSAEALLAIVNDILDMSKLETDKLRLHYETFDFTAFISNLTSIGNKLTETSSVNFSIRVDEKISHYLTGDETRLRQIMLNLIDNAVKFTKEGSVDIDINLKDDEKLRIDVADTGIGMGPDLLVNIFEPFVKSSSAKANKTEGSGLGLPIARNLVELMDGEISVLSEPGKGSIFSFEIPYIPGDEEALPQIRHNENIKLSPDIKVLVVDDNAINLRVSSGLLKVSCGIACDTAQSGYEAIELLKQEDYDIVFMDHMMPEMNGVETTKLIRGMGGKYKDLPIIALTANAVIGVRAELLDAGMNDYLTKPININLLREALCNWISEEKRFVIEEKSLETSSQPDSINQNVIEQLAAVNDLNPLEGLVNIGGEESLYIESIDLARRTFAQTADVLDKLLDEGDFTNFHIHVHGLKSSFANVGAIALSEMARDLEKAASDRDLDYCHKNFPELYIRIKIMCNELDKIFSNENEKEKKVVQINSIDIAKKIDNLLRAIQDHEYETISEEIETLSAMDLGNEKNDIINKIRILTDSFEYNEALKEIEKLIAKT